MMVVKMTTKGLLEWGDIHLGVGKYRLGLCGGGSNGLGGNCSGANGDTICTREDTRLMDSQENNHIRLDRTGPLEVWW